MSLEWFLRSKFSAFSFVGYLFVITQKAAREREGLKYRLRLSLDLMGGICSRLYADLGNCFDACSVDPLSKGLPSIPFRLVAEKNPTLKRMPFQRTSILSILFPEHLEVLALTVF